MIEFDGLSIYQNKLRNRSSYPFSLSGGAGGAPNRSELKFITVKQILLTYRQSIKVHLLYIFFFSIHMSYTFLVYGRCLAVSSAVLYFYLIFLQDPKPFKMFYLHLCLCEQKRKRNFLQQFLFWCTMVHLVVHIKEFHCVLFFFK